MSVFHQVAAVLVGVGATARLTRLVVFDSYPPAAWLRMRWDKATRDGPWSELVHCGYCASPYIGAIVLTSGLVSHFHPAWWIVCGWLAGSYAAAIWVRFDGSD